MKELEPNSEPSLLDSESPWPGLRPFSEENAGYFFGRDREVREIARKVQQETVTLLFGKSGLGKTSILRAGLSPLLRKSGFVPIYIRLNHFEESLQLEDQVEVFMEEALDAYRIDAPRPIREETLWEHFHKKDGDWWDEENRLLKPVLIFDQFEEILTSGQENSARVVRSAAFLTELEDLIENRPPASLLERFKTEKGLAKQYDLDRIDYRVVLSLREDYLADLEGLRERLRMIMHNRYRLLPLNGVQAMNVILEPGGHLVDETAANDIVNFVASPVTVMLSEEDMGQSESRQVEPALLSVILRELNNHRIRAGEEKISSDMVINRRPEKILSEFYEESLKGLDSSARLFIEKQLLTASGARNRVAEEDAITLHGLTEELIEKLINRRIIQREKTARMSWLELSHDTLTQVVRLSAEDYQRRQRRRRFIIRAAAGFLIVIGLGVFGYYWQAHEQNLQTKEAAKLALDVAEDLEYNYTISMRGKQRILDRLDDGFVRLRGFAGDSSELKARNIRFLLASAAMQLETGYFQRASDSLKAAQALLWVDDSGSASLPASNLLLARFELVRAETENVEGDSKDAWKALRQAEHLLQSTISAGAEDSMERTELWQRMNRIKVKLLSEQGDWNGVVELFKAARAEINATLAETEINLKMTEQEAEAKRIHQQVLFTELLKLHSERTYLARTHNLTDFSDIHAEFEEDLQRAEPLFNGDARRQWLFFRSMRFVATAFYYIFDSKHIQGRAAIDIAIDNLAGLVRSNPDNLRYRHVLGEILLRRASFTRNRDPLQSKVDIQAARSLAFTLRKDSPHPYQGFNLSIRADFYQAELDYANKVDGADSALKMLARLDAYRNEIAGTLQADSLAVFGYYWAIKSLIRKGSLDRALEMADSALNLLEARKNDWDEGFLANRRYWIHDTILTAEKADDIEEAVWSRHFQGALEMAETLIQR
ncbi:MAG: hypothetical protein KZQ77_05640, partial [Candidatus Thiodiazotropha sp. (ex Notomyrtea botanica)]|nr:hypothetical protein [Candidatus Thiodiazotropha sp. (ex Notomyrtea botanica)]